LSCRSLSFTGTILLLDFLATAFVLFLPWVPFSLLNLWFLRYRSATERVDSLLELGCSFQKSNFALLFHLPLQRRHYFTDSFLQAAWNGACFFHRAKDFSFR
jgi:hypothetical protein